MKINDVTIDDKDRIIGMDASFTEHESKCLISLALNMLYQADRMFFNMHIAEWEFTPDVYKVLQDFK